MNKAGLSQPKNEHTNGVLPNVKISPVKIPTGAKQIGNYILGKTIGVGSFGKVHLGLHIPTGERVAVKILQKLKMTAKDLERVQREINILSKVAHSSLIQLYEIIQTEKSLLLITEFMPRGELFNYILQKKKLPEDQACKVFQQIVDGIDYLHTIGVAHRDLKPENILIDYNGQVKIIDFGLSNTYQPNQKLKTQCGSPCYAAPEMIEGKHKYEPLMIDIWSAGIVLFAMICGYLPFCDSETPKLYKKILSGTFKFPAGVSEQAKDLVCLMLRTNPSKRATLLDIKSHAWFTRTQYTKSPSIDLRYFSIEIQPQIIKHIKCMGHKTATIEEQLYGNKKTKETALYYILAKKLSREGCSIPTFIGNQDFNPSLLKALSISAQEQNTESTVIEVECVPSVAAQKPPLSGANLPSYNVKSVEFKNILTEFLTETDKSLENRNNLVQKKQNFYINIANQKKKECLRLNKAQNRSIFLLKPTKNRSAHSKLQLLKPYDKSSRKGMIKMIQDLKSNSVKNASSISKTASSQNRNKPALLLPTINKSVQLTNAKQTL